MTRVLGSRQQPGAFFFLKHKTFSDFFLDEDLAFAEAPAKLATLNDGLRHGSQGAAGTKRVLELATGLIEQYAPEQRTLAPRIRERLSKELEPYRPKY
jgi:hypothetical protein